MATFKNISASNINAIDTREKLLTTLIFIRVEDDDHGCTQYERHTPFAVCENIERFYYFMNMLTPQDIVNYEDQNGGNILYDIIEYGSDFEYVKTILEIVGDENFSILLHMANRYDMYMMSTVKEPRQFEILLQYGDITLPEFYNITKSCNRDILQIILDRFKSTI